MRLSPSVRHGKAKIRESFPVVIQIWYSKQPAYSRKLNHCNHEDNGTVPSPDKDKVWRPYLLLDVCKQTTYTPYINRGVSKTQPRPTQGILYINNCVASIESGAAHCPVSPVAMLFICPVMYYSVIDLQAES